MGSPSSSETISVMTGSFFVRMADVTGEVVTVETSFDAKPIT